MEETVKKVVKPLTYAPVTIVEGEQKSGKTNYCVSRVIDAAYKYLTDVKLKDGTTYRAEPVLNEKGFAIIGLARIWFGDKSKVVKIPPGSVLISDKIRIFANFHLKGVRYRYLSHAEIAEHLNDGSITGLSPDGSIIIAFLVVDEAYIIGDKRMGLSPIVKVITRVGYQFAKRHLNVIFALPDADVLDFRIRGVETERVVCSYDETREAITAEIRARKRYKHPRSITYSARQYWKYYDPDEQFALSNNELSRAVESMS